MSKKNPYHICGATGTKTVNYKHNLYSGFCVNMGPSNA
jgi:hypothetical protein